MFQSIGQILVSPSFRIYAEKNETAILWFRHTLVCQFQSLLNRFVEVANNYTSQHMVENGGTLEVSLLDGPYKTFIWFINNLDDSINNSSNVLFSVKPLLYIGKSPNQKRKNQSNTTSNPKKATTIARVEASPSR